MTRFFDESRPRLGNGRPCWLGLNVALPGLHILPLESGLVEGDKFLPLVEVEIIVNGSWVTCNVPVELVPMLLEEWKNDPEQAIRDWFEREPPEAKPHLENDENTTAEVANAEELGL